MAQLEAQLFMEDEGIVRLFTPPFDVSDPDPGYIRAYPPGVREYREEPYVVAADVFSEAPPVGCGGWIWYTGPAGWM